MYKVYYSAYNSHPSPNVLARGNKLFLELFLFVPAVGSGLKASAVPCLGYMRDIRRPRSLSTPLCLKF